ncbi:MAG: MalY/PatB family protein [Clostridia bacterium]|nr:MalY/PatB family protein [Clostridia bacterium]
MPYDFDELIDRSGTHSIKYEAGKKRRPPLPEDHIPLWVADMDFACPEPILEAMRKRLDRRILGYTSTDDALYCEAVTGWMRRRYGWNIRPEWLSFSSGIVTALYAAVDCLTGPGDEVLVMTPAYHPFDLAIRRYDRRPLYTRLKSRGGHYTIDWEDFEDKARRKSCTLLFFCSPHNPTGRVWTEEELRRVGEICIQKGVFIVSDEIHADLLRLGQRHIPLAKLFPDAPRMITCTAPSKTFNIAGNRHANLIIPDPDIRRMWNERANCGHAGALTVDATIAAYTQCDGWLDALRAYLDGSFQMLDATLKARLPKAVYRIPEGTYLAWIDFSRLGLSDERLNELISEAGVFAQFAGDFVDNAAGCMRLNMASPRAVLEEAFARIVRALERY